MLDDIAALESMKDPGHIMNLFVCVGQDCDGCTFNHGSMDGGCCKGLRDSARRHYQMFMSGSASQQALANRFLTLVDYFKWRMLSKALTEPVTFLPPCRWATGNGTCTWCTNPKCRKYFNGPCSKRCEDVDV